MNIIIISLLRKHFEMDSPSDVLLSLSGAIDEVWDRSQPVLALNDLQRGPIETFDPSSIPVKGNSKSVAFKLHGESTKLNVFDNTLRISIPEINKPCLIKTGVRFGVPKGHILMLSSSHPDCIPALVEPCDRGVVHLRILAEDDKTTGSTIEVKLHLFRVALNTYFTNPEGEILAPHKKDNGDDSRLLWSLSGDSKAIVLPPLSLMVPRKRCASSGFLFTNSSPTDPRVVTLPEKSMLRSAAVCCLKYGVPLKLEYIDPLPNNVPNMGVNGHLQRNPNYKFTIKKLRKAHNLNITSGNVLRAQSNIIHRLECSEPSQKRPRLEIDGPTPETPLRTAIARALSRLHSPITGQSAEMFIGELRQIHDQDDNVDGGDGLLTIVCEIAKKCGIKLLDQTRQETLNAILNYVTSTLSTWN